MWHRLERAYEKPCEFMENLSNKTIMSQSLYREGAETIKNI